MKQILLILSTIFSFQAFAMRQENENNPVFPMELNKNLIKFTIDKYIKNCKSYNDFLVALEKIRDLKTINKSYEHEINLILKKIKLRLSKSKFKNKYLDYKYVLMFLIFTDTGEETINFYIDSFDDPNLLNHYSWTALMITACANHKVITEILIQRGADIDFQDNTNDLFGSETALTLAGMYENLEIAELLIKSGADINLKNSAGETALIKAVFMDKIEMAKLLIQSNANVNLQNNEGDTALFIATMKGKIELVKILVNANADINLENQYALSPINLAVHVYKNIELINILKNTKN